MGLTRYDEVTQGDSQVVGQALLARTDMRGQVTRIRSDIETRVRLFDIICAPLHGKRHRIGSYIIKHKRCMRGLLLVLFYFYVFEIVEIVDIIDDFQFILAVLAVQRLDILQVVEVMEVLVRMHQRGVERDRGARAIL